MRKKIYNLYKTLSLTSSLTSYIKFHEIDIFEEQPRNLKDKFEIQLVSTYTLKLFILILTLDFLILYFIS